MAAKQGATVSVRILLDEEKNKVVCAEASNDFVEILFSFMTLPMGTIARLVSKQKSSQKVEIGCMTNLYQSVENLNTSHLWTGACKDMLLHPRNPCETICMNLKVNIDDAEPTKYYVCSDIKCNRSTGWLSNYMNRECSCGNLMNKEISVSGSSSKTNAIEGMKDTDGVFVKGSTAFIISDDLKVMPSSPGALVELLVNLGIKDVKRLEEKVLSLGSEEIVKLLECSLLSQSPLTDVFLPNKKSNPKRRISLEPRDYEFISEDVSEKAINRNMAVKIFIRKSDGTPLYAEAMEDFVDLLFSFLTIHLANVVKCLAGESSSGCIDNLYKSIKGLGNMWFVPHTTPWRWMGYRDFNSLLLSPGLAPNSRCKSQPFEVHERTPEYYCHYNATEMDDVGYLAFGKCPSRQKDSLEVSKPLTLIDPKCPEQGTSPRHDEFVKKPATFLVSDGLVVLPTSGTTSSISYVKELAVSIDDIEEHEIKISKHKALNLLKASLVTTSALATVLTPLSKKRKQEF